VGGAGGHPHLLAAVEDDSAQKVSRKDAKAQRRIGQVGAVSIPHVRHVAAHRRYGNRRYDFWMLFFAIFA
jgi:hypothetical protein